MTASSKRNWAVFFTALLLVGGTAIAWLSTVELVDDNIRLTVRHSAQLAFVLYIVIIVVRPLQDLLNQPWTTTLRRQRRLIGVAFIGVMTAHLALIVFRFASAPELTYPIFNLIVGGGAYAIFYLMFITSFDGPTRALGPKAWKILHRTGLIWGGVIFGLPRSVAELTDPDYLKFGIPFLLAILIRLAAWRSKNIEKR